jgi:DNA-binding response OmpR family regulator
MYGPAFWPAERREFQTSSRRGTVFEVIRRVLIIEADEWISTMLARSLEDAGYDVDVAGEARLGLDRARRTVPDCIICDVVLPDIDGFWLARRLRSEPGPVGTIPFLFLTDVNDAQSRQHGLEMGADAYISKPFRTEEVVAQVAALIGMAQRLRAQLESLVDAPASSKLGAAAFRADLSQFSVATALTILEMERRTGTLRVKTDRHEARIDVVDGTLLRIWLDGRSKETLEALRIALRWTSGRFSFEPTRFSATPGLPRLSITASLLEVFREEDEAKRRG